MNKQEIFKEAIRLAWIERVGADNWDYIEPNEFGWIEAKLIPANVPIETAKFEAREGGKYIRPTGLYQAQADYEAVTFEEELESCKTTAELFAYRDRLLKRALELSVMPPTKNREIVIANLRFFVYIAEGRIERAENTTVIGYDERTGVENLHLEILTKLMAADVSCYPPYDRKASDKTREETIKGRVAMFSQMADEILKASGGYGDTTSGAGLVQINIGEREPFISRERGGANRRDGR